MKRLVLLLLIPIALSGCTRLFFHPMNQHVRTPADIDLDYRDIRFNSADGTALHGWLLPARQQPAKGSILFFHGNAENISTHIGSVYWLPQHGYNVFMPDYRGYGRSDGSPAVDGIIADTDAAIETFLQLPEIQAAPRAIIYGQSLGGALAIHGIAHSRRKARFNLAVIESAFSDYRRIAREKLDMFWLTWPLQWPLSLTIDNSYSPEESVAEISPVPLLLIYSESDRVVPVHHGRLLYEAAAEPKTLWQFEDAPHTAIFRSEERKNRLMQFIETNSNSSQ